MRSGAITLKKGPSQAITLAAAWIPADVMTEIDKLKQATLGYVEPWQAMRIFARFLPCFMVCRAVSSSSKL